MVQIGRGPSNGMSFDLKKPPGHVAHHMDLSAHSALSHYTSQMGMKAAMVEAGVTKKQIEVAFCGSAASGSMAGQRVLKRLGMNSRP